MGPRAQSPPSKATQPIIYTAPLPEETTSISPPVLKGQPWSSQAQRPLPGMGLPFLTTGPQLHIQGLYLVQRQGIPHSTGSDRDTARAPFNCRLWLPQCSLTPVSRDQEDCLTLVSRRMQGCVHTTGPEERCGTQ